MNTIIAKTNKLISILLLVIILSLSFLTTLTYAVEDLNSDKYSTVQGTNSTTKVTKYDNEKNTNINELTKNDDDESQKDNSDNQSTNLKEIEDSNSSKQPNTIIIFRKHGYEKRNICCME